MRQRTSGTIRRWFLAISELPMRQRTEYDTGPLEPMTF